MKTIVLIPSMGKQEKGGEKTEIMRDTPIIADHKEFNQFENQGFTNNRRFEGRHKGGQSDQPFPQSRRSTKWVEK
ncbi:hypothetical protein TNCV_2705831 [Trichonephila clavipes]|nr:hypothetical protein TNCV_2705831 [Trichonephila clavipes]